MAKIVYMTRLQNTKKFVKKVTDYSSIELSIDNPFVEIGEPFIIVVPSYELNVIPAIQETFEDLLDTGNNLDYCRGVMGGGNRNFAELFCITAKNLAEDYDLPLLHEFEFQGSNSDVQKLKEEMDTIANTVIKK